MTWNTDTEDMANVVKEFEAALPGFWWSTGQCSVGAHASCAVDGNGVQKGLMRFIPEAVEYDADGHRISHPFDSGFHADTDGGSPADALRDVMAQALAFIAEDEVVNGATE
jgi:hypothetical protein